MPQSLSIGLLILGGVLLLVAIIGGGFKIFGAEVADKISSGPLRLFSGGLGIFFLFLALSPSLTPKSDGNSAPPGDGNSAPFLVCGEAVECSFILWDGASSREFVVEGVNMHFPIEDKYLGFSYCMNAAPSPAPMPKWPACYGNNAYRKISGHIKPGQNG